MPKGHKKTGQKSHSFTSNFITLFIHCHSEVPNFSFNDQSFVFLKIHFWIRVLVNEEYTNTVFFRGGGFNNYKVNAAIEKNFENKKFWKKNTFFTGITVLFNWNDKW